MTMLSPHADPLYINDFCTTLSWREGSVFIEGVIQRVNQQTGSRALGALVSLLDAQGPAALAEVQGDFVALVRSAQEVHAFKSFTSQFQLYYCPEDGQVSNRLYPFWKSDGNARWSKDYFARHCLIVPGFQFMSDQTPFDHVRRVLPGELVTFTASGIRRKQCVQRRYQYNLDTGQTRQSQAPTILELLRDAVKTRLDARAQAGICVEISGGLDSSFVACLLGEQRDRGVRGVMFSQPGLPSHAVSEQYARDVAQRYGIGLSIIGPEALPWDAVHMQNYSDEPSDFFWYGDLFSRAVADLAEPGSYIFTGYGADQLFLRSPAFLPYLLRRGEFAAWRKVLAHVSRLLSRGQLNLAWQSILSQMPPSWHRALCNSRLFANSSLWDVSDVSMDRMLTNHVPWLRTGSDLESLSAQRRQAEDDLVGLDGVLCDDWGYFSAPRTVCQAHFYHKGLVDASPFCDLALMDHMYNHVSAHLVHDFEGPYKVLLREAQKGIVPETLRNRKSDTFVFNSFQLRYLETRREQFEAFLDQANPDWIDVPGARLALEQLSFGMATSSTRSVMALLGYLQWQQTFVELAPRLQSQPEAACQVMKAGQSRQTLDISCSAP